MSKNNNTTNFSLLIIVIAFIAFIYILANAAMIVDKRQIGTSDGIYTNKVTTSEEIKSKAFQLSKGCQSDLCKAQRILNYVTGIPYKINHFQAISPQKTIQNNFGDCDDKSNLLISMLHAVGIESYFVLVPKHIFVISAFDDIRLAKEPTLLIDGKKFYILESTAKGSPVGFPLTYSLSQIEAIVEPFENEKLEYFQLRYRN